MNLPRKFGAYNLVEIIARGGMAEVYRATISGAGGFEKTVAVKMVLPHLAEDEQFVDMLIDEARIIVNINHSNIAQVLDLGKIDDIYYIAMEFINGLDLDAVLKATETKKLPIDHALFVASNVLAGLHHAHQATDNSGRPLGIVHRDISPHNILISLGGDIKIIDFGVAKVQNDNRANTRAGVIKGKLLYMSPEQAMAKEVDGRADIFAVGVNLYRMLTGILPFEGNNEYQIYNNILTRPITPPKDHNPEINEEINQVVMMLLHREIHKRYQDGYSAKLDIERALQNVSPGYSASRFSRYVENNLSHLMRRQVHQSGVNDFAPNTPATSSIHTGEHKLRNEPVKVPAFSSASSANLNAAKDPMIPQQPSQAPTQAPFPPSDVTNTTRKPKSNIKKLIPPILLSIMFWMISGGLLAYQTLVPKADVDIKALNAKKIAGKEDPLKIAVIPDEIKADEDLLKEDKNLVKEGTDEDDPKPAKDVSVSIKTIPPDVIAKIDGTEVGITPMNLLLEESDKAISIVLELEGFESQTIELIPSEGIAKKIKMVPIAKEKRKVAKEKRKVAKEKPKKEKINKGKTEKKRGNAAKPKKKKKKKAASVNILLDDDPKPVKKKDKKKVKKQKKKDAIDIFDL